jgi:hypothetical protein
VSFIARYLSFTSTGSVNTRLPTKTKKFHIFVIFHRKCSILTIFYNPKESAAFFREKFPKLIILFLALALRNLTVLAYDNLFIFYWRIYRTVRNFNFTVRKSFIVPVLVNDKYQAMNDTSNPTLFKFKN